MSKQLHQVMKYLLAGLNHKLLLPLNGGKLLLKANKFQLHLPCICHSYNEGLTKIHKKTKLLNFPF